MNRREFLVFGGGLAAAALAGPAAPAQPGDEWRNRQAGMSYRRLGRTGFMVSEFACGGNTISPTSNDHVRLALDMGLNYLDTAPAYGRGESERGYAAVIAGSASRQRVFLATKVSPWDINRAEVFQKMFDSLADSQQKRVRGEAAEYLKSVPGEKSDYFGSYFPSQWGEVEKAALANVMDRRYGSRLDKRKEYYGLIIQSVEDSLKRLDTDYVDVLHCPHGANTPGEMEVPEVFEAFERLKKAGKVRHLGFSSHSNPAETLRAAVANGMYSLGMIAYSITNHEAVDAVLEEARAKDVGVIAMKSARPVWPGGNRPPAAAVRVEKLQRAVPGEMKVPMKAYLWVLRNPNVAAVNSELINADMVRDNLPLAGRKL